MRKGETGPPGDLQPRRPAQLLPTNKAARSPQGQSGRAVGAPSSQRGGRSRRWAGLGGGPAGGAAAARSTEVCALGGGSQAGGRVRPCGKGQGQLGFQAVEAALGSPGQGLTTPSPLIDSTGYFGPFYRLVWKRLYFNPPSPLGSSCRPVWKV